MNLKEQVYKMFILGTEGGGYKKALSDGLGGIIFFTHDIINAEQFKSLVKECKDLALFPPLLSIDQEGGRVERTENIHGGKKYLSAKYAYQKGLDFLKKQTEEIAKELKIYGLNLNFAPCIDVNTNPNNPIIGERAFSNNPDEVIEAGNLVAEIYRKNGIIPCVKHFPGHGDANSDSHLTLPKIVLPLEEMEKIHIKPFAICSREMVMVAHLHCTCFEKNPIPTSLSKNAIDYLRNKIGFKGIIISDDMVMKGISNIDNAVEKGIRAGLNMFIYRDSKPETIETIENIIEKAENDRELREKIEKSCEIISKVLDNRPEFSNR